jgi:PAS domain S-box-containing protein
MLKEGKAKEAPTNSEQELHLLVEAIPTLVWRAGPEGNIEYVNKRVLEYLGAPLGEVIGWGWMEKVHPDDVAFKVRSWLENLESGTAHDAACRFRGADGQYRWFAVRGEPLRSDDGRVLNWYGVLIDIDDQRKAEEALRESEYKLRQIIDTVPGLIWSTGPNGEPTHVSQRLLDYSGMRFEDFKHGGWEAFVHPADFPETAKAFYHAIQTGTSYQGVMRLRRADREFRWHHARCEPLRDRQGRIIQWYGLSVDIDEAKKAEEQPTSAAQLQATLNVIPAYTWYAAPSGGLTFVNKRTADYLGLPKDHPLRFGIDIGAQWDAHIPFLHPDDQEGSRKDWPAKMRTGEASEYSFRVRNAQGGYRWFLSRVEPLRASDGTLLQWVGVNLDIEELKCAEQALRESEAKFRDYAESASDWLWEIGPDYKITLLTENAFGTNATDRIGRAYWDRALDLETEPEKWRLVRATLDARKPFRDFVYCSMGGDGSPMYVKGSGKPVFDANGEFRGYRGTGADVTAAMRAQEEHERLRQLESDLAHMNRLSMMGELAASLAHEITQPIASARNNARAALNFLDKQPPDLGEVREALGCVVGDADRAGDIVDRIRDHIKKAPPRKRRFDLNEAINEVIVLARSVIGKNGVSVQTRLTEGLTPVEGDRVQLQQVILNLILNAVEAMSAVDEGVRELLISTEQSRTNGVLVAARDSGPGIDPEHIERVFDAFYTTKSSGMGMGLSICRSIIDGHGGRLWADANEPRGAVFQFTLPSPERSS